MTDEKLTENIQTRTEAFLLLMKMAIIINFFLLEQATSKNNVLCFVHISCEIFESSKQF